MVTTLQQRDHAGPDRPRLHLQRSPRRRQDLDGPDPCQGPQLRDRARRRSPATPARTAARSPNGIAIDVREIDGASNRGIDEIRELRENVKFAPASSPLQDLHHRRGPHAHQGGLQRPAEDARGAARPRDLRLCHHGDPQGPGDDPLPLPVLRFPADLR
ncbi:MAG: hypothetical protein MZW92_17155 [Comamonadaceae bacterium]|nr:hypothetical protein [Comamonadaceae bacterium]